MQTTIKLRVAESCHENWNTMSPAEQGRFCASCQKKVTDFTQMNDKEILQYISEKGASMCGRFENGQLNREIKPIASPRYRWSYIWNVVAASVLTIFQANAQVLNPKNNTRTIISNEEKNTKGQFSVNMSIPGGIEEIKGTIIDEKTNQPIVGARVTVKGTSNEVSTNDKGEFTLKVMSGTGELTLVVSSIGYFDQEHAISRFTGKLSFYLQQVPLIPELGPDSLPFTHQVTMGIIMVTPKIRVREKIKREVMDKLPEAIQTKYVKVYPNPVASGTSFRIDFNNLPESDYSFQVIDAAGNIVYVENLFVKTIGFSKTIQTEDSWSAGIYWVRLLSKSNNKVYTAKLVIQ
jgi:CarboxypepD_reg-like domain/Secretion system C-terminal sorting domain